MGLFKPNVGKPKGKRDVQKLIEALKHKDNHVKEEAAEALGVLSDKKAIDPLVHTLEDVGPLTKDMVDSLSGLGEGHSVATSYPAGDDWHWYVSWAVADALDKLGWRTKDEIEQIWFSIYCGKWNDLVSLGQSAIGSLILMLNCLPEKATMAIPTELIGAKDIKTPVHRFGFGRSFRFMDAIRGAAETVANLNNLEALNNSISIENNKFIMAIALSKSKNTKVIEVLRRGIEQGDSAIIAGAYQLVIRLGGEKTERHLINALEKGEGIRWHSLVFFKDSHFVECDQPFRQVLAEDFFNCGNMRLEIAADKWAAKNGLRIARKAGYDGPKWGEGIDYE